MFFLYPQVEIPEGRATVTKPTMVHGYNSSMNGCDRMDQMISYYGCHSRKTIKWWRKVFTWIIEILQSNAHILYNLNLKTHSRDSKPIPLIEFKKILVLQLRAEASSDPLKNLSPKRIGRPLSPNTADRKNKELDHLVFFTGEANKRCVLCLKRGLRRRSRSVCFGCPDKPALCIGQTQCFFLYHTVASLDNLPPCPSGK